MIYKYLIIALLLSCGKNKNSKNDAPNEVPKEESTPPKLTTSLNIDDKVKDFYEKCSSPSSQNSPIILAIRASISGFLEDNCEQVSQKLLKTENLIIVFTKENYPTPPSIDLRLLNKLDKLLSLQITFASIEYFPENTNLKSILLYNSDMKELAKFSDISNMTSLTISDGNNVDFDRLKESKNLLSLSIRNMKNIQNIESLSNLTYLESLNLNHIGIDDVRFLNNLTVLKVLNLSNNPISKIDSLSSLVNLKTIYLTETLVTTLAPLKQLKNISIINIPKSVIKDEEHCPVTEAASSGLMFYCRQYIEQQ